MCLHTNLSHVNLYVHMLQWYNLNNKHDKTQSRSSHLSILDHKIESRGYIGKTGREESAETFGPERIKQPWQISLSQLPDWLRPAEVLKEMN